MAVETMTRGLAQAGVEAHVLTTNDDGAGLLDVPLGVPVVRDGVTHWFLPRQTQFYKFSLPLALWLTQHVRDYDVAHTHALFTFSTMPGALFAARARVPYIVRPLGTLNRFGMMRHHRRIKQVSYPLIERRILEGAAVIHYTSEQERREASEFHLSTRNVVLPLGVPFDESTQGTDGWLAEHAPQLVDKAVILFLGRLDPIKGLDLLLEALATVKRTNANVALVIAGEGGASYVVGLKARASSLGISEDVLWVGQLGKTDKQGWLHAAKLLVLPSYSENFGIVVIEAMAAGLPVVVSERVGVSAWVSDSQAGLVTPYDADSLANAITKLCGDMTLRTEMGQNGRRLARETFSVEATTKALVELYAEINATKNVAIGD